MAGCERDAEPLTAALRAGREALQLTVRCVQNLPARYDALEPAFAALLGAAGRIVVTGIGKSGLIGGKLAATLASTGTPALFVHAAEALHGDAGMLVDGDLLLAISNSGTTQEVVRFAELAAERGNTIVAMTGCGGSSPLCRIATAVVDIGVECESDPYKIVPSASTTVTVVVGDVLAIGLMVARGFGPADFHRLHPSGALGSQLSTELDERAGASTGRAT